MSDSSDWLNLGFCGTLGCYSHLVVCLEFGFLMENPISVVFLGFEMISSAPATLLDEVFSVSEMISKFSVKG